MSPELRAIGTRFEQFVPGWPASADPEDNADRIFTYEVVGHTEVETVEHRIKPGEVVKAVSIRPATDEERKSYERRK